MVFVCSSSFDFHGVIFDLMIGFLDSCQRPANVFLLGPFHSALLPAFVGLRPFAPFPVFSAGVGSPWLVTAVFLFEDSHPLGPFFSFQDAGLFVRCPPSVFFFLLPCGVTVLVANSLSPSETACLSAKCMHPGFYPPFVVEMPSPVTPLSSSHFCSSVMK